MARPNTTEAARRRIQATTRAATIAALGWAAEDVSDWYAGCYAATTGELLAFLTETKPAEAAAIRALEHDALAEYRAAAIDRLFEGR